MLSGRSLTAQKEKRMGCDIHCYIEHKKLGRDSWSPFGGRINPGRNYAAFGMLAGVRSEVVPAVQPRGIPDGLAYEARGDWWLYITSDDEESDGCTSLTNAERYIARGSKFLTNEDGKKTFVEHPDWHTPSWMTPDEWITATSMESEWNLQYRAMAAAMRSLEEDGQEVRVVFWFDN